MSAAVLRVRDLHVTYASERGPVEAVRGVDLDVHPGRTLALVGESGSGKSAVALGLMGLLPADARVAGEIFLHDEQLVGLGDRAMSRVRGRGIGMVFQDPLSALTPIYTVGRQVSDAVRVHTGLSRARADERALELLDLVGLPQPRRRATQFPHEFSGGMRQRVVIALAIANDPDVIVADEPTTALDVTVQAQILDVLEIARRETGAGVVLITHDLGVVAGHADDVAVMYAGRVVERAGVQELFARPAMPYTLGLMGAVPSPEARRGSLVPIEGEPPSPLERPAGCPFAPRCPLVTDACRTAEPTLVPVTAGHDSACVVAGEVHGRGVEQVFPVTAGPSVTEVDAEPRDVVLRVRGLRRGFPVTRGAVLRRRVGTVQAVDGVDLDVRAGETVCLVGESGSGKTTALLEILALRPPEAGSVEVLGVDVADPGTADLRRLRRSVQIVMQDPQASLDPRLPVFELLAEPLRAAGVDRAGTAARVAEVLALVGLPADALDRFPAAFSGGQRQRLAIARALTTRPDLVVLDEPVSALDVSVQAGVLNLLDRLQAELGLAYLVVAHDLAVVRHIADTVAVMYFGRIVEHGPADAVFAGPRHPYTQALLSAAPLPDPARERARARVVLVGEQPNATAVPPGCAFADRCPLRPTLAPEVQDRCRRVPPTLDPGPNGVRTACHAA